MLVTVAICTWNRAELLRQTLEQMCALRIPAGVEWELIVVDNNCTDDTPQVVARFTDRLPVQRVVEPRQGQSNARNRAMQVARGDLLVWTDDDVLVDEEWLSAYVAAAERWPAADFFGGLITPWFEADPPNWFQENARVLEGIMVTRDLGSREARLNPGEFPYGANMAFRRRAFQTQSFDPNLGLVGDNAVRFDEVEYCKALERAGFWGVWVPAAKVRHFVVARRMTLEYVWKHFEGEGRGTTRINGTSPGRPLFGAPRWLYRQYAAAKLDYWWKRARRHPEWLRSFAWAAQIRGSIVEHRAKSAELR